METEQAKLEVEIPFIPIVCAAPLLLAAKRGLFEQNGVRVRLRAVPGWSCINDLVAYQKADVAHMLAPMLLASHLGLDGKPSAARQCSSICSAITSRSTGSRNLRFAREGLRDAAEIAERVERQQAVIAAQEELIQELSTR